MAAAVADVDFGFVRKTPGGHLGCSSEFLYSRQTSWEVRIRQSTADLLWTPKFEDTTEAEEVATGPAGSRRLVEEKPSGDASNDDDEDFLAEPGAWWEEAQKLKKEAEEESIRSKADQRPSLSVVGSWDKWREVRELRWTGEYFSHFVQLGAGSNPSASFRILKGGDRQLTFYPSVKNANPYGFYRVKGPGEHARDLNWTVGKHSRDRAKQDDIFEIKIRMGENVLSSTTETAEGIQDVEVLEAKEQTVVEVTWEKLETDAEIGMAKRSPFFVRVAE
eukprot:gnl/TRDRNA2_/TRDRNA2_180596_c0_seq1.p1 gnl/TRDRNA2_/TRDRNA2_180596_c0~~gnl/TRDRNA2_/TRDRNA2_180596_c0_seq1.p1  ORF type:complete len:307 (-),score=57.74 gnl/TRDRNA2_/TRDRNA2_180596_c0_seq1:77-907(-)